MSKIPIFLSVSQFIYFFHDEFQEGRLFQEGFNP